MEKERSYRVEHMNCRKTYKDSTLTPEERASLLLQELNLDEKMAQVNCVFPFDKTYLDFDWIREQVPYGIGEVSTLEMRRIKTLQEAADWQRTVQQLVMENSPHGIPAIFHMEGLCGAFLQEATSYPSGIARGAGFDPKLEEKIGESVARQETACGITHILAPVLDISRDSRMGRQGETYGEDPTLAAALGSAYAKGAAGVTVDGRTPDCVAKHFLAFHNSQGGIHGTHSETTERTLQEIYGKPFQAAIRDGRLKGIMPCYCSIDDEPVSVSKKLLTGLLREEMGFDGICVSDYGGVGNSHNVQHIGETLAETGYMAMEAGMDIEMPNPAGYGKELRENFVNGTYDISVLDKLVYRVLCAKFRMGLFEHPYAMEGEPLEKEFKDADAEGNLSLQSALESMVLLKNDGILPLDKKKIRKIAVIGPHADNARMFFGGYTHMSMMESTYAVANSIAGVAGIENETGEEVPVIPGTNIQLDKGEKYDEILKRQKPECLSLVEYLTDILPDTKITYAYGYPVAGEDVSGFEEAFAAMEGADVALLTLGGKYGTCSLASMGEGVDATNINLPQCQDRFIEAASGKKIPLIGIHFNGRPISSDVADQYLNAILEAWTPAEYGARAVYETLFGINNPSGKLPVSVAYNAGQIPVYYNHPWGSANHQGESIGFVNYLDMPHTPRYCFGYGLSYSNFAYSDFHLDKERVLPTETITVSVKITNQSDMVGTEIVQLYLSDRYASRTRPVQELASFIRVALEPGESRMVSFRVQPSQLAFLDKDMRWKIEKGAVDVRVGSSSEDIRLEGTFSISENQWIRGRDRAFYAEVEVL